MRRSYRIHEDANYVPTQESIEAADAFYVANRSATEKELTDLARRDVNKTMLTDEFVNTNGIEIERTPEGPVVKLGAKVTGEVAKKARESFLTKNCSQGPSSI